MNEKIIILLIFIFFVISVVSIDCRKNKFIEKFINIPYVEVNWYGKNNMTDCNDFTTHVGPYKDSRGGQLRDGCNKGFKEIACDMSLSRDYWVRKACGYGRRLRSLGIIVDWEGKNAMVSCNDFTTRVGPYKDPNGGWLKAACKRGYGYGACDTYKNYWQRKACGLGYELRERHRNVGHGYGRGEVFIKDS